MSYPNPMREIGDIFGEISGDEIGVIFCTVVWHGDVSIVSFLNFSTRTVSNYSREC